MSFIYVASPYEHADLSIKNQRFEDVTKYIGWLFQLEIVAYSPITHNHTVAQRTNLPHTWDFWKSIDFPFLESAHELHVLMLPGWKESIGVSAEIKHTSSTNFYRLYCAYEIDYASQNLIPVKFINPDNYVVEKRFNKYSNIEEVINYGKSHTNEVSACV